MIVGTAEIIAVVDTSEARAELEGLTAETDAAIAEGAEAGGADAAAALGAGTAAATEDLEHDLGQAGEDAGMALSGGLHDGAEDANDALGDLDNAAEDARGGMSDLTDVALGAGGSFAGLEGASHDASEGLDDAADHAAALHDGMSDLTDVAGDAALGLGGLSAGAEDAGSHFSALSNDVEDAGETAGRTGGGFKNLLSSMGVPQSLLGGWGELGVAVAGTAAAGLDLAEKMQDAETEIADSADTSAAAAKRIGDAFLATAGHSEFSGLEMANAYAAVAGQLRSTEGKALDTAQAMKVMSAAGDLAVATTTSLSSTTSTLASIMQAFSLRTTDASYAADVLYKAGEATGQGAADVGSALTKLKTKLGDLSPDLGQMGGLLVDLTDHGETGRGAMMALNTTFTALLKPTSDMVTAQKSLQVAFDALPPSLQAVAKQYEAGRISGEDLTNMTDSLSGKQGALFAAFVQAADGMDTARAAQDKLGIETVNSRGQLLSMSTIIGELHDKISGMSDAEATATLEAMGFGNASSKLVSTIQAGAGAYDKTTAAVTKAGSAQTAAQHEMQTLDGVVKILLHTLEDWTTDLGQALLPVLDKVGIEGLHLAEVAGPILGDAFRVAGDAVEGLVHGFSDVIGWFRKGSAPALALASAIGLVLAPTFVKLGIDAVENLAKMAAGAAESFGSMIAEGATWVAQNAAQVAGTIARNAGLQVSWGQTAASVQTAMSEADEATEQAADVSSETSDVIQRANMLIQSSEQELSADWAANVEKIDAMLEELQSQMEATEAEIAEANGTIAESFETTATTGETAMEGLETTADTASEGIDAAVGSTGVGAVLMALGLAATLLMGHWREVWDGIKDAAVDAWHFLDDDVLHPIEGAFDDCIEWIKSHWELLLAILLAPFSPVLAVFLAFHDQIIDGFEDIWHAGVAAWDYLWDGIKDVFDDVTSRFETLNKDILAAFKTAGTWLLDAGRDLIRGLVHGIEDEADDAVHAVMSIGHDIEHGFDSFFGIASPSTRMRTAGNNIVDGLVLGLSDRHAEAVGEMARLSSDMTRAFTQPEFGIGGLGGAGYVPGQASRTGVTLYVQPGAVVINPAPGNTPASLAATERAISDAFERLASEINAGIAPLSVKA